MKIRIEAKKLYRISELNQSQLLKQHVEFNTKKRIEAKKKKKMVTKMEKY